MQIEYSILNDTLNGAVAEDSLDAEIRASDITIALDGIITNGDTVTIVFKANLISGEQDILNTIVAAHKGIPLPEHVIDKVQVCDFQDLTGHNLFRKGYFITITAGQTMEYDSKYSSIMKLQGVAFDVETTAVWGDYVELELVDKDNILGYGVGVVLGKFGETIYVHPGKYFDSVCSDAKDIPAGIYIRFRYVSTGSNDVRINLQHILRTV